MTNEPQKTQAGAGGGAAVALQPVVSRRQIDDVLILARDGITRRDTAIQWHCVDSAQTNWRARFNDLEIGGYSSTPSEHWNGLYCWFGAGKYSPFPKTEQEARELIEATFMAWLRTANQAFNPAEIKTANAPGQRPGAQNA